MLQQKKKHLGTIENNQGMILQSKNSKPVGEFLVIKQIIELSSPGAWPKKKKKKKKMVLSGVNGATGRSSECPRQ